MAHLVSNSLQSSLPSLLGWRLTPLIVGVGVCTWFMQRLLHRSAMNPNRLPLPPGPKGLPLFGNMFQLSPKIWETYTNWSREYGDVLYTSILGDGFLVLNSQKAIHDLLEKKGSNFSDRKRTPAGQLLGLEWNWGFDNYGADLKANRRLFHQSFGQNAVPNYYPIMENQMNELLKGLYEEPETFRDLTKRFFGSCIIQMAYGIRDKVHTDQMVHDVDLVLEAVNGILTPGRYLVDALPWLRFVPSWFPGAQWKRQIVEFSSMTDRVYHSTYESAEFALRSEAQAKYPSALASMIENLLGEDDPLFRSGKERAKSVCLMAYITGVDSQASAAAALILALAKYPQVQEKCQEELNRVIGPCQLPKPSDINSLPYLQAVIKELIRWHSVGPLGIPHLVKEDDEYNGYFIPKGTIVFGNIWALMHDPKIYEDAMEFKPERFLTVTDSSVPDPFDIAFGFGRRVCPGRQLATATITFMAASLMSVFAVSPARDQSGNEVPLDYDVEAVLITAPLPFKCHIEPRSLQHAELVAGSLSVVSNS